MLNDLTPSAEYQATLFASRPKQQSDQLMQALDAINARYGTGTVRPAVNGLNKRWRAQSNFHSNRFTTSIEELMSASSLG